MNFFSELRQRSVYKAAVAYTLPELRINPMWDVVRYESEFQQLLTEQRRVEP